MPALPNLRLISHKSSICFFERFAWQAVFSRPFFQKNYPHSLAKCLSCRCRQQREKYAVLRQEQSVSCQSKILPQYQNSLFAHFAPAGILLGSAFPKPCLCALTGEKGGHFGYIGFQWRILKTKILYRLGINQH